MQLFVMRHGEASYDAPTDDERELTERGVGIVCIVAEQHKQELASVDVILHSPLVRARQTAEFVAQSAELSCPMEEVSFLRPETSPQKLADELAKRSEKTILLVSHQPFVSRVLDWLTGSGVGFHPMTTASIAKLECDIPAENLAELHWLHHPS
ncbi:MAG: phosphohistidine phosphatase SixA [Cellvibrionaceae bacterium]